MPMRVCAALALACALGTSAGCSIVAPVSQAESSPLPGARVETLEFDFIVMAPADSVTIDLGGDLEQQTQAWAGAAALAGPVDPGLLVEDLRFMRDAGGQLAIVAGPDVCAYAVMPALSVEFVVALASMGLPHMEDEMVEHSDPAAAVELHAGPAVLNAGERADAGAWANYVGRSGSVAFTVRCSGSDARSDGWRSFADALRRLEQL